MQIVVIGMGYVGIPCAALLADVPGFQVIGVQRRSARSGWKIDALNAGECPIQGEEPGLPELIRRVVCEKKTFRVTDDISVCADADAILLDVQTPVDEERVPRYESLCEVAAGAARYMRPGTLVVIESTVAPGSTRGLVQPILEAQSGLTCGRDFYLAFSPERVMPGKLLQYIAHFPRIVGGVDAESTRRAVELYSHIVHATLSPADCLTAEVAKTVENTFRDVNIAFANEMALACASLGVDVFEVRELVNARPDRHMHLPGAGVGGHCLPKDPWLLKHGVDTYGHTPVDFRLLSAARSINEAMPGHLVEIVRQSLAGRGITFDGAHITVLGVAYLEDSDDTRNTPAAPLIRQLSRLGARVAVHDPYVREADLQGLDLGFSCGERLTYTNGVEQALAGADCAVLVTKHRVYLGTELLQAMGGMRHPILIDGRGCIDRSLCLQHGIEYRGLGRGDT